MMRFPMFAVAATTLSIVVQAQSPGAQSPGARPPVPGAPAGVTAFVNVAVVPMDTERVLPEHTVFVENGWITALGPASKVEVPAGATTIDGRGKYLIPGLGDMHVHFQNSDSARTANLLFVWLANGITTARSMDYTSRTKGRAALQMRALAAAGKIWSPRLYVSAPWADPRNNLRNYIMPPASGLAESQLDSVAAYVAAYKAQGYDHIKLYHQRGLLFDSLAAATRRLGVPLVGHVPGGETLDRVLSARVRSIEHLTGYGSDTTKWPEMITATVRSGVWNSPGPLNRDREEARRRAKLVKLLYDAGAGVMLGSDGSFKRDGGKAAAALHGELQVLVQNAGLTPYQALVTSTRNIAAFYGTLDERGTIAVGKQADLVLLTGNPLVDIRSADRPAGVMVGGRWLPRAEIDRRLTEIDAAAIVD